MKAKRLTLFVSALLALGLASCGETPAESSKTPDQSSTPAASSASKTSSKTATPSASKSSTPSKTSTPAPVERPYISLPFGDYAEAPNSLDSNGKWVKGASFTWTFWCSRAEQGITVAIGAKMTNSGHTDRSLFTNHEGASSSDPFESDEANDGTPRLTLENNGTAYPLTNTKTYGECLDTEEFKPLELGEINVVQGKNVVKITTHASAGYRLYLGDTARLYYGVGEESLQGEAQTPTYAISSVSIANEEEHAVLSYHVDYTVYDFDEVKALDWHAGFQGNENAGGRNWNYYEITPLAYAQGAAAGEMLVKVNLDSLTPNRYSSKFGIGTVVGGNNNGQAQDVHFAGDAAAYTSEITVGTKTYTFKADGGDSYWNLPSLVVVDSAEPTYTISEAAMSNVNNRAIITYTVSFQNYTLAEIQAMNWKGAFQRNGNVNGQGDWSWYLEDEVINVEDSGVEGKALIKYDVTDLELNCYMGKLGVGLQESGSDVGHPFGVKFVLGQPSKFQIANKVYEFQPAGNADTWDQPALYISHGHVYEDVNTLMNADGKPVTVRECSCHAREIVIDYTDGITYKADGTANASVQAKMDKGFHTSWKISVDKAIEGAELYFEGDANVNNNRYFFNQNKEVNPVNPITNEEYPDDTAGNNADKATEDAWRYMFGVGAVSEENPMQHPIIGTTMAEAGAGQKPMLFGNINLAAGENVISLYQMNIGFRLTFSGKVHIRYNTDATITGDEVPAPLVPLDRDPVSVPWATALQSGALDSSNKWNKNTTYTLKVTAPEAAPVVLKLTMKGSEGNGQYTINGTGQGFTITVNGKAADNLLAGKSYTEAFGEDQTAWVQVAFAQFECVAGENTIVIQTNNGGYRLSTDPSANVVLDYRACLPQ